MLQNKYFDIFLENPFKTYKKIKKYFLPLKPNFEIYFGKSNKAKILEINSFDVMWKDKYNSPRHETDPRVYISLFNAIHIVITFRYKDDFSSMIYWETALWWLYYKLSLQEALEESYGWGEYNGNGEFVLAKFYYPLKKVYKDKFFNKQLNNVYYDSNIKNV